MVRIAVLILACAAIALGFPGCSAAPAGGPSVTTATNVVTDGTETSTVVGIVPAKVFGSPYPVEYLLRELADDTFNGVHPIDTRNRDRDPHAAPLSARQRARIGTADAVYVVGEGFRPALDRAVVSTQGEVIDVLESDRLLVLDERGRTLPHGAANEHDTRLYDPERRIDPHIWLDPTNMERLAVDIAWRIDTSEKPRLPRVRARLRRLDAAFSAGLKRCETRDFVAGHAAWAYLARRYRLRQHSLAGLTPADARSPATIAQMERRARAAGARDVLVAPGDDLPLARRVATSLGGHVRRVDPLERLSRTQRSKGATYDSVMRSNLKTLQAALRCDSAGAPS